MKEYQNFLKLWQHIRDLNESDIYLYGEAGYNRDMQPCVFFDDGDQRAAYKILSGCFYAS